MQSKILDLSKAGWLLLLSMAIGSCSDSGDNGSNPSQTPPRQTPVTESSVGHDGTDSILVNTLDNAWYQSAEATTIAIPGQASQSTQPGKARNVILFVGDGMGVSTVTAARILDGQKRGMSGESNNLSFDTMPFAGLIKTYNVDAQTPDSAGTMTAIMTGVKTDAGVIGIDEDVARGQCDSAAGNELVTALELAELQGKSTGIVSTARITHATPAATYARAADRAWEDNSVMSPAAVASGCRDIASQLIDFERHLESRFPQTDVDGMEVIMGGGRRHFLPDDAASNSSDTLSEIEGRRTDGRHLVDEWSQIYSDGTYVFDQTGFDAVDTESTAHLFGLFSESHMLYETDRSNDAAGEPSLAQMTEKAIEVLDNNEAGFFLMVESGRIDHAHHAGNAFNALEETIELSRAVQKAIDMTLEQDTLIIVTADHGHVFTISGYPARGNPILGKVINAGQNNEATAADNLPYTTLGYANGRGFADRGNARNADGRYTLDIATGRTDLSQTNTQLSGFHQEAFVPLSAETHSGEDVAVYASGPGAALLAGTSEQNLIFHVMNHAASLSGTN